MEYKRGAFTGPQVARRLTLSLLFLEVNVQPLFDQPVLWGQFRVDRFYSFDGGAFACSVKVRSIGRGWRLSDGRIVNRAKVPFEIGRGDVVVGVFWIEPDVAGKATVHNIYCPNTSVWGKRRFGGDTLVDLGLEKGSFDLGHVVEVLPVSCSPVDSKSSDHGVMSVGEGVKGEKRDVGVIEEVGRVGGFFR